MSACTSKKDLIRFVLNFSVITKGVWMMAKKAGSTEGAGPAETFVNWRTELRRLSKEYPRVAAEIDRMLGDPDQAASLRVLVKTHALCLPSGQSINFQARLDTAEFKSRLKTALLLAIREGKLGGQKTFDVLVGHPEAKAVQAIAESLVVLAAQVLLLSQGPAASAHSAAASSTASLSHTPQYTAFASSSVQGAAVDRSHTPRLT